jgi:hypothetical protein
MLGRELHCRQNMKLTILAIAEPQCSQRSSHFFHELTRFLYEISSVTSLRLPRRRPVVKIHSLAPSGIRSHSCVALSGLRTPGTMIAKYISTRQKTQSARQSPVEQYRHWVESAHGHCCTAVNSEHRKVPFLLDLNCDAVRARTSLHRIRVGCDFCADGAASEH